LSGLLRIVEAPYVVEYVGLGLVPRPVDIAHVRSVLNYEKKLSIAALSET
jgi:hypothetical protein